MEKHLRKFDYNRIAEGDYKADVRIEDDILILDDYLLDSVYDYSFVASRNTIILVKEGFGSIIVDGQAYEVKPPCVIIYFKHQNIRTDMKSDHVLQWSMEISDRFLTDLSMSALKFNDIRAGVLQNPVTFVNEDTLALFDHYADTMVSFAMMPQMQNKLLCIKHLTLALFYGPMYEFFKKKQESATFRTPKISSDFFDLLEDHFKTEHNISFYAGNLKISEKYLYVTIMSATGKSPRYWIDYKLFVEAKRLLVDRELSIQQISDELHFSSLSAFGKFFTRLSGLSPRKYREDMTKI